MNNINNINDFKQKFDQRYQQKADLFGTEPVELVVEAVKLLKAEYKDQENLGNNKPLKALDLGVGNGRNALYLLKQGFEVTGVDLSSEALKVLKKRANEQGFADKLQVFNGSVTEFPFVANYDLIIGIGLLHFLTEDQADIVVDNAKTHTNVNGFNVWIVRMQQNMRNSLPFVFYKDKLSSYYSGFLDWDIVKYEEDGRRASIIAKKVS